MNNVMDLLNEDKRISDYKIQIHHRESYELFFVKGDLETVRCTDTCDKEVTVYVAHDGCMGEAQFFVYPSTTQAQLQERIDEAVAKALLIHNQTFVLPEAETGSFEVESNFAEYDPADLGALIADAVFRANDVEHASLNAVEIFITRHVESVQNSRGLHKSQVRYSAMVEAIPTYNGLQESVELYEQYNFGRLDPEEILKEIRGRMVQVTARSSAVTPDKKPECSVVLHKEELAELFWSIAGDLNYSSVYAHANLWQKGDAIQKDPEGDLIGIRMAGEVPGCISSAKFDSDGMALGEIRIVEKGRAVNYYGSNRFGQYLGEVPTGDLKCICVDPGTLDKQAFETGPCLEVLSMSGLQVDFYSDYIGGEIRLAYYHTGTEVVPVTGISISGSLNEVLGQIRLSKELVVHNGYSGPDRAVLNGMKIF